MEKIVGVILMAGLSTRFGGPQNKTLCLLNGKPLFSYSIDTFANSKHFDELLVVVSNENGKDVEDYLNKNKIDAKLVLGGKTRQESVEHALSYIEGKDFDIVVIHDAARPLVDELIISEVIKGAKEEGASTAYLYVTDTIAVKNEKEEVVEFVPRSTLASIQTPQAFKVDILLKAHNNAKSLEATDDCSLVLALPHKVKLVKGDKKYHKVTTPEDIRYLEGLISKWRNTKLEK